MALRLRGCLNEPFSPSRKIERVQRFDVGRSQIAVEDLVKGLQL
jgi:hypothetical protein